MARLVDGWSTAAQDTVLDLLKAAVATDPDRVFLDFSGRTHTYAEIDAASDSLAAGFEQRGVEFGDTVFTMLDNSVEAVLVWFAVNKLGGIIVPANTALKGEFLSHQLTDAGSRLCVMELDYADRLSRLSSLAELKTVIINSPQDGATPTLPAGVRVEPLSAVACAEGKRPDVVVRPADVCCLIYTAGTTGPSKGCTLSHNYVCLGARQSLQTTGRTSEELHWTPLPLFHLNAMQTVVSTLMLAGTTSIAPRFSLRGFWPEIERTGAQVASALGSMIPLIARAPDSPHSLRCHGQLRAVRGAPFTPELEDAWRRRFGVEVVGAPGYGLTEASKITTVSWDDHPPPGSSGRVDAHFDVRIFDDDDNELAPGQVGEVVCRPLSPSVMFDGYWGRPEATVAVSRNSWFHTGDLGRFDEQGFFYFVDRKKDYLRRRGENISSYELEQCFLQHPEIHEVAAHAVLSELTEDDLKVTAIRTDGSDLTAVDLFRWCLDRVPYYALPRYIEFRDSLPKNAVGRVLKFQLREEGVSDSTWDRERAGVDYPRR